MKNTWTFLSINRITILGSSGRFERCAGWRVQLSHQNRPSTRSLSSYERKMSIGDSSTEELHESIAKNISHANGNVIHNAAIALGSNLGDKVSYIEQALAMMNQKGIRVVNVSHLYETKAMYYENQDTFVNGACHVETTLEPLTLLDELQDIENKLGRVRKIDKGPRTLDLDIALYDDQHIMHERLQVPHKLLLEREFVLRPLNDILPQYTFPISFSSKDAEPQSVSHALERIQDPNSPMHSLTVVSPNLPYIDSNDPERRTQIMSILNITPDSFSDGGKYTSNDLNALQDEIPKQVLAGATIFDIGGQSTRPKADLLSPAEELQRILPVIEAIRSMPESKNIAISIDTFYSVVARETAKYDIDIINDVSAGLLDPDMLPTVAELGKTIVLMHMRGDPHTMTQLTDYPNGVVNDVATELAQRITAARNAGIHPWRIMLDPGIGFAKTQSQNLTLLRDLGSLHDRPEFKGYPWLLGVSRKGFIGKITGVGKASERVLGTAVAVTASVAGGADIVRVHDVQGMVEVVKMADAIYRVK